MNKNRLPALRAAGATLALLALQMGQQAAAAPVPMDINVLLTQVYNDRIGNSRFFSGPNTDRIRISSFVQPSPDSDSLGISNNGGSTALSFTHPTFGVNSIGMTWVGINSGLGGGANEYTYSTPFASTNPNIQPSPFVVANLAAFDASPFVVTVTNPLAPTQSSLTYNAPDYDMTAMPGFVTGMKVTAGLTPTIEWEAPAGGSAPSNVSIQIRHIDSQNSSKILTATLVHNQSLPLGTTSYSIPAGVLLEDQQYEISVQLDVRNTGGALKGRSRSFFEYSPIDKLGNGVVAAFLPSVDGTTKEYRFNIPVAANEQIALDPLVAVGYDYQIGEGDPLFASVMLPDIGDGLFDLYLFDGSDWMLQAVLAAGQQYFFGGAGVDRFRVLGIEIDAGLDPSDVTAFITTVTFAETGRFTGTMTPITVEVPEPTTILLFGVGLLAFGYRNANRVRPRAVART
jgi:hypothetical protein